MGIFGRDKDKTGSPGRFLGRPERQHVHRPPPGVGGPAAAAAAPMNTYVVVKGDTLSKIAQRAYGDARQWRKIYEANKDMIKDPT